MKQLESTKLFYGRYPYKLVWNTPISGWFRGSDLKSIRNALDHLQRQYNERKKMHISLWSRSVVVLISELHDAQKVYTYLNKETGYRIRVEGTEVSIYSECRDWLWSLCQSIPNSVTEWWEPTNPLQPNTVILSERLKGWEYRITLGANVPKEFINWAQKNLDKLRMGSVVKFQIKNHKSPYLSGYYFYVRNDKMLSLVSLILGSSIARIDKIIIEDKNA